MMKKFPVPSHENPPPALGQNPPVPVSVSLWEALEERYLAYALSTIVGRALPDVRDGLKPVHRRILYGMHLLKLDPTSTFKKCAKIVGDVMGAFHPHGDQALYDALVRLAQDFASRYPLIEGQGNFGNIDGDSAAAYRYTEARLSHAGKLLLDGISENAIDFRPNYSAESEEPIVLPAAFPNLLANGAQGIAVGMATSIPPHNVAELCAAALFLIAHPQATVQDLMHFIPGPDFPTGGILVDRAETIAQIYTTGQGSLRLRACWHQEKRERFWHIVVTEIPYMVQKGRLIEHLAALFTEKKLPFLADIRDESSQDIRLILEPRSRDLDPQVLMEILFKQTELESRIPVNMNVLIQGQVPRVIGLHTALSEWLLHRRSVLKRRVAFRHDRILRRLEVVDAFLLVYLNLDEVIRIIREEDDPKEELKRHFSLTDVQANSILDTRLRALRKLEEQALCQEQAELLVAQQEAEHVLAEESAQWEKISQEIQTVQGYYASHLPLGRRHTHFAPVPNIRVEELTGTQAEQEALTLIVTERGWIRVLKGHHHNVEKIEFQGDDRLKETFCVTTPAKLLLLVSTGQVYTIDVSKLIELKSSPMNKGANKGTALRLLIDCEEKATLINIVSYETEGHMFIASSDSRGFRVPNTQLLSNTRKGKQILTLEEGAQAKFFLPIRGDHIACIGQNRKLLIFPIQEIPEMNRGKGVRLQKYKEGTLNDVQIFNSAVGLRWIDSSGREKELHRPDLDMWLGKRAEAGKPAPKNFPKQNQFRPSG